MQVVQARAKEQAPAPAQELGLGLALEQVRARALALGSVRAPVQAQAPEAQSALARVPGWVLGSGWGWVWATAQAQVPGRALDRARWAWAAPRFAQFQQHHCHRRHRKRSTSRWPMRLHLSSPNGGSLRGGVCSCALCLVQGGSVVLATLPPLRKAHLQTSVKT